MNITICIIFLHVLCITITSVECTQNELDLDVGVKKPQGGRIAMPHIIAKAAPYEKIHIQMYGDDLKAYELWPELNHKTPTELVQYCNWYLRCFRMLHRVIECNVDRESTTELMPLMYHIMDERIPLIGGRITRRNFYKTRLVRVLTCRINAKSVYRFIKAAGEYSVFYIMKTNTKGDLFTIAKGCPTNLLNIIISEPEENKQISSRNIANAKMIRQGIPYQKIHFNMHGDNLEAYKTWSELEGKKISELNNLCYKYINCTLGIKPGFNIKSRHSSIVMKLLKYYFRVTNEKSPLKNFRPTNRLVRVLICRTGFKCYQFVKADDEKYTVFHIITVGSKFDLYTIVNACPTEVFNSIEEKQR